MLPSPPSSFLPTPPDLAAIPDFQSGAMENWGLTTYRESALLYDPDKSSASSRLWITMIIAHELAHQVRFRRNNKGSEGTHRVVTAVWMGIYLRI